MSRARKVERFLSQPNFVAEQFTGTPGKYVKLEDTIAGFDAIIKGEHDELPEAAFYMVGPIEDVVEKARLARAGRGVAAGVAWRTSPITRPSRSRSSRPTALRSKARPHMLIVPGAAGEIGVLARHAPLVATLKAGSTRVHLDANEVLEFATGPGVLQGRARPGARARRRRGQREGDRRRARSRAARGGEGRAREGRRGRVERRPLAARAAHRARREPAERLGTDDRLGPWPFSLARVARESCLEWVHWPPPGTFAVRHHGRSAVRSALQYAMLFVWRSSLRGSRTA